VRLNVIFKEKEVKKLFLTFLILMVGLVGISAIPNRPGGGYEAPQSILPQDGVRLSTAVPVIPLGMRARTKETAKKVDRALWLISHGLSLRYVENAEFLDESVQLITVWTLRYLSGQLSEDDFKTLVAGRMDVMKMRLLNQTASIGLISVRFPLLC
jgi:hypothetical protein